MPKKTKVLIVDDHRVVREGLCAILETKDDIQVVGEAKDGGEAVEQARTLLPDVILMDVSMPGMTGIEATRIIKREFPHIGVVALTMYEEQQYIFDLVRAGATGYLLKDCDSAQIIAAIRNLKVFACWRALRKVETSCRSPRRIAVASRSRRWAERHVAGIHPELVCLPPARRIHHLHDCRGR